jgi:SOS response regulatory protein OraA/RecX
LKNEQDRLDAEEAAEIEATTTANESERASLQMTMMRQAGIPEETVEETLEMNDLSEYYTPPGNLKADDEFMELVSKLREDGFSQEEAIEEAIRQLSENMAQGHWT